MPGLPDVLNALQTGGQPVGNLGKGGLPLLEGLGAQQDYLRGASPAELAQVTPPGQQQAMPAMDPMLQALIMQILSGGGGVPPGAGFSPAGPSPATALGGLPQ